MGFHCYSDYFIVASGLRSRAASAAGPGTRVRAISGNRAAKIAGLIRCTVSSVCNVSPIDTGNRVGQFDPPGACEGPPNTLCYNLKEMTLARFLAVALATVAWATAQSPFTLEQVMSAPFPSAPVVWQSGGKVAWVYNARGVRNIWVAEAPEYTGHRVTAYT